MNALATKQPTSLAAIWWAAIRPNTLWAGATPVIVGSALAFAAGPATLGPRGERAASVDGGTPWRTGWGPPSLRQF